MNVSTVQHFIFSFGKLKTSLSIILLASALLFAGGAFLVHGQSASSSSWCYYTGVSSNAPQAVCKTSLSSCEASRTTDPATDKTSCALAGSGTIPTATDIKTMAERATLEKINDMFGVHGFELRKLEEIIRGVGVLETGDILLHSSGFEAGELVRKLPSKEIIDTITRSSGADLGQIIDQTSVNDVIDAILKSSGVDFGTVLGGIDIEEVIDVILGSSGSSFGALLSDTPTSDVLAAIIRSSGDTFGELLDHVGPSILSDVFSDTSGVVLGDFIDDLDEIIDGSSLILNSGPEEFSDFINSFGLGNTSLAADAVDELGGSFVGSSIGALGATGAAGTILSGGISALQNAFTESLNEGSIDDRCSAPPVSSEPSDPAGFPSGQTQPSGLYVPVHDFANAANSSKLLTNTNDIIFNTDKLVKNTNQIKRLTSNAQYYLAQLCRKEYVLDPQTQHQWMVVSGLLTRRIVNWIETIYAGNPIYVTNPYVYYRNVDIGVQEAFMEEIQDAIDEGDIDARQGRILIRTIESSGTVTAFPDPFVEWDGNQANKQEFEDDTTFTWEAFMQGALGTGNTINSLVSLAQNELELRRGTALEYEREKLAWGRGFFPYERCGQSVFSENPNDIRTCETLVPGATIQDVTSIVLSSAIRQIENADEYQEWISRTAFTALNEVFYAGGLRGVDEGRGVVTPSTALDPEGAVDDLIFIDQGDRDIRNARDATGVVPKDKAGAYFGSQESLGDTFIP